MARTAGPRTRSHHVRVVDLLSYDEDTAFTLMDDAATINAIVRRVPVERLASTNFGDWTGVDVIGHVTDVAEVFAERVRRVLEEVAPHLEAIPDGMSGDPHRDPMDLARRLLRAHQQIVALMQVPGAGQRPAIHSDWGRVTAAHLAGYQARHSHEHTVELSREFPPAA